MFFFHLKYRIAEILDNKNSIKVHFGFAVKFKVDCFYFFLSIASLIEKSLEMHNKKKYWRITYNKCIL